VTPERGPETELTQTVENQRTGHEPEDLLREPEAAQAEVLLPPSPLPAEDDVKEATMLALTTCSPPTAATFASNGGTISLEAAAPAAITTRYLVDAAPEGDAWFHEQKFDGYRIVRERPRPAKATE
jgi:ATP-dependent DNA ligase